MRLGSKGACEWRVESRPAAGLLCSVEARECDVPAATVSHRPFALHGTRPALDERELCDVGKRNGAIESLGFIVFLCEEIQGDRQGFGVVKPFKEVSTLS